MLPRSGFVRTLLTNWWIVALTTLLITGASLAWSLTSTAKYASTVRLFVSTAASSSVSELYQNDLFSQQRVLSYAQLVTGKNLAQLVVDKLNLPLSVDELRSEITATPVPDTVLLELKVTDTDSNRATLIADTAAQEFVGVVERLEGGGTGIPAAQVAIVEPAEPLSGSVSPNTMRNTILGLFLGLLVGSSLALLRGKLDNTVKDRESLSVVTRSPAVGAIPAVGRKKSRFADFDARHPSEDAEPYRQLRTNLQFLNIDRPPRTFVITSALSEEGKTTTTLNLGLALAEAGHTVALVEGDLRRPELSRALGAVEAVGLTTVLTKQISLDEALQKTATTGLLVLSAGPLPPNPSELLGSSQARKVLDDLRERFDFILIDAPPLLSLTDAVVLAAEADGVLFVSKWGTTSVSQIRRALADLAGVNAKVLGSILTLIPGKQAVRDGYLPYTHSREVVAVEPKADLPTRVATEATARDSRSPSHGVSDFVQ